MNLNCTGYTPPTYIDTTISIDIDNSVKIIPEKKKIEFSEKDIAGKTISELFNSAYKAKCPLFVIGIVETECLLDDLDGRKRNLFIADANQLWGWISDKLEGVLEEQRKTQAKNVHEYIKKNGVKKILNKKTQTELRTLNKNSFMPLELTVEKVNSILLDYPLVANNTRLCKVHFLYTLCYNNETNFSKTKNSPPKFKCITELSKVNPELPLLSIIRASDYSDTKNEALSQGVKRRLKF